MPKEFIYNLTSTVFYLFSIPNPNSFKHPRYNTHPATSTERFVIKNKFKLEIKFASLEFGYILVTRFFFL